MKPNLRLMVAAVLIASLQISFAADADLSKLAAANNDFSFKLLKQLVTAQPPGANVFVSPYSAATALQMAANGAAGQTKTEMQQVLETSGIATATLNEASKAAADLFNSPNTNVILTTANALWYRQNAAVKPGFLEENQKYFGSTIKALDFGDAPAAEAKINQWASDQTHGRITGIADGMITPDTDLILASAIYFKGKWEYPFDAKLTKARPFHPVTDAAKNVPMMEMSEKFNYRKGSGYQAVRLPYMGYDLAMYVFLTDTNYSPAILVQNLDSENWHQVITSGFSDHDGLVVLPKFKLENTLELNAPLEALGMKTAFNQTQADFSVMFSDQHYISEVRQKAFVEVNEKGTEAAVVTGMGFSLAGAIETPPPPFEMIVDRPFLFAIVDARTEMILFMGVVNQL